MKTQLLILRLAAAAFLAMLLITGKLPVPVFITIVVLLGVIYLLARFANRFKKLGLMLGVLLSSIAPMIWIGMYVERRAFHTDGSAGGFVMMLMFIVLSLIILGIGVFVIRVARGKENMNPSEEEQVSALKNVLFNSWRR